jgi:ribonuclease H2 subunit C
VPEESDLEDLDEEEEEAAEPVQILETVATFEEVTVWGHDQLPAADDPFVKGIEEWIAFAEAIHSGPAIEGTSDKSSV